MKKPHTALKQNSFKHNERKAMNKQKYSWTWMDNEAGYFNKANNLEAIIYEIVNYYFYSGNDAGGIEIEEINNNFIVKFTHEEGEAYCHTVKAEPYAVSTFLEELAELVDREDKFSICKN